MNEVRHIDAFSPGTAHQRIEFIGIDWRRQLMADNPKRIFRRCRFVREFSYVAGVPEERFHLVRGEFRNPAFLIMRFSSRGTL